MNDYRCRLVQTSRGLVRVDGPIGPEQVEALAQVVTELATARSLERAEAKLAAVRALAEAWKARAAHDLEFAKTVPAEIRPSLIDAAAEMKAYALKVLATLDADHHEGTG